MVLYPIAISMTPISIIYAPSIGFPIYIYIIPISMSMTPMSIISAPIPMSNITFYYLEINIQTINKVIHNIEQIINCQSDMFQLAGISEYML